MTYAYSVFANNGVMVGKPVPPEKLRPGYRELDPVAILRVEDAQGSRAPTGVSHHQYSE